MIGLLAKTNIRRTCPTSLSASLSVRDHCATQAGTLRWSSPCGWSPVVLLVDWCSSTRRVLCSHRQSSSLPAPGGHRSRTRCVPSHPQKRRTLGGHSALYWAIPGCPAPRPAASRTLPIPFSALRRAPGPTPAWPLWDHHRGRADEGAPGHGQSRLPLIRKTALSPLIGQRAARAASVEKTVLKKVHTILSSRRPRREAHLSTENYWMQIGSGQDWASL
jgi:hypothetical protein